MKKGTEKDKDPDGRDRLYRITEIRRKDGIPFNPMRDSYRGKRCRIDRCRRGQMAVLMIERTDGDFRPVSTSTVLEAEKTGTGFRLETQNSVYELTEEEINVMGDNGL